MKILLIGNGKWGKNYINNFNHSNVQLDVSINRNWKEEINDKSYQGVIIATPPSSHIEIAEFCLQRNLPILIEKPIALSKIEILKLSQYQSPILVNYIHLFSTSYQKLKKSIDASKIDKIFSLGYNNGPKRDYSSLWDYGCHDISMILDLAQEFPYKVYAEPIKTETGVLYNIKLYFNRFETESLVGNGGKHPIRKLKIHSDGLKYIYDDKMRPHYHEPSLYNAIQIFLGAIDGKEDFRLGLDLSLKITEILEICQKQCNNFVLPQET